MTQPSRDASGKFVKRESNVVGISHGQVYHDQPIEYEDATPRVPTWAWMLGLAALIIAAASYGAVQLAQG